MTKFVDQFISTNLESARKEQLDQLAKLMKNMGKEFGVVRLNFICTHNSRRSQLAQVLMAHFAFLHDVKSVKCYSGGTEATAFNHRMVNALLGFGYEFKLLSAGENPKYVVSFDQKLVGSIYFSKKYDHEFNPTDSYLAIMVCDDADQNCPIVSGSTERFSLSYEDPKSADDTDLEMQSYTNKILEIGREMLYVVQKFKSLS